MAYVSHGLCSSCGCRYRRFWHIRKQCIELDYPGNMVEIGGKQGVPMPMYYQHETRDDLIAEFLGGAVAEQPAKEKRICTAAVDHRHPDSFSRPG